VRSRLLAITVAAIGLAVAAASPASADILAVAPVSGHSSVDVGLLDVSTGSALPLPAGVNTSASENHPSISNDGKRLVFERRDQAAGTDRFLVTDLTTGQTTDLFDSFTVATWHPTSPVITPDGGGVTTGSEGAGVITWAIDDKGAFSRRPLFDGDEILDPTPVEFDSLYAFRRSLPLGTARSIGVVYVNGSGVQGGPLNVAPGQVHVAHPAIGAPNGTTTILYDIHNLDSNLFPLQGDIGYCVFWVHNGSPCGLGRGLLPALVSSPRNETRPAFTPDGRYIGFIRDEADGHERLYVFDTATQTLVDSDGVDLGNVSVPDTGSLSLYERFVLKSTSIPNLNTVGVSLSIVAPVGIFVQRVVGHHRLLGRRVPALRTVGRIPLGRFGRGKHRIHWQPRVNGHRLRPGRYQFTVRALSRSGKIRDLGRPRLLRVH
jgi:hypothetical protein